MSSKLLSCCVVVGCKKTYPRDLSITIADNDFPDVPSITTCETHSEWSIRKIIENMDTGKKTEVASMTCDNCRTKETVTRKIYVGASPLDLCRLCFDTVPVATVRRLAGV